MAPTIVDQWHPDSWEGFSNIQIVGRPFNILQCYSFNICNVNLSSESTNYTKGTSTRVYKCVCCCCKGSAKEWSIGLRKINSDGDKNLQDVNTDVWTLDRKKHKTKKDFLELNNHHSSTVVRHCKSPFVLAHYPAFQDLIQRDHAGTKKSKTMGQILSDIKGFPNFTLVADITKPNWELNKKNWVGNARRGVVEYLKRNDPNKQIAARQSSDDNGVQGSDNIVITAMAKEKKIAGSLLLLARHSSNVVSEHDWDSVTAARQSSYSVVTEARQSSNNDGKQDLDSVVKTAMTTEKEPKARQSSNKIAACDLILEKEKGKCKWDSVITEARQSSNKDGEQELDSDVKTAMASEKETEARQSSNNDGEQDLDSDVKTDVALEKETKARLSANNDGEKDPDSVVTTAMETEKETKALQSSNDDGEKDSDSVVTTAMETENDSKVKTAMASVKETKARQSSNNDGEKDSDSVVTTAMEIENEELTGDIPEIAACDLIREKEKGKCKGQKENVRKSSRIAKLKQDTSSYNEARNKRSKTVTRGSTNKHVEKGPKTVKSVRQKYPSFKSFYVPSSEFTDSSQQIIRNGLIQLVTRITESYENYIIPIIPYTNPIRMNHQTPQAIRIFFGMNGREVDDQVVMRRIYGPMSVVKTTGPHPSKGYRVYPFSPELISIRNVLTEELRRHISPHQLNGVDLDFNFMEIKMYKGKDIFQDDSGNPITDINNKPVRTDCNKSVGMHNDLNFADDGTQNKDDTAHGNHPILTYTLGSGRELIFSQKKKTSKIWQSCPKNSQRKFDVQDGSMFILLPADEIPQKIGKSLYKTQHMAKFKGEGLSIGFVFRSVKAESYFKKETNEWLWERDEKYINQVKAHLERTEKVYETMNSKTAKQGPDAEISVLRRNMLRFITGTLTTNTK